MASKMFFVFMMSILQCGLVLSTSPLGNLTSFKSSPISMSELVDTLRHQESDTAEVHYLLMILVSSYGGRLYETPKNLSLECSRTIRATMLTMENLAVSEETNDAVDIEYKDAVHDVRNGGKVEEHPLEAFCRRIEKSLSENAKVSQTFEKAKKEAASFNFVSRRPPYARSIIKSSESVIFKLLELLHIRQFARLMAVSTFADQTDSDDKFSWRVHYFVKSCLAMAKKTQFAESMQSMYSKVLDEIVVEIGAEDRMDKFLAAAEQGGFYWIPIMTRTFYKYIASDPSLKQELESMAAIVGKNASKEDLDFTKL